MKIPTTAPGNAPFYHGGPPINGMEMNPQWQGNGVMPEGGAPGNGAMYMMTPPAHMPAFVGGPTTGYYPTAMPPTVQHPQQPGPLPLPIPVQAQDFSEYMWMENEEEFDKQVMQQLEEEALMEQCIEAMLADEREALQRGPEGAEGMEEQVSKSTLNPLAAEFVPTFGPPGCGPSSSIPEIDCPSPDNSTPSPLSSESDAHKSSASPANHTPQRTITENTAHKPAPPSTEESKTASEDDVKIEDTKKAEVSVDVVKVSEVSAKASRTEGNRPPAKPSSNNTSNASRKNKAESVKKGTNDSVKSGDIDAIKAAKVKENVKQNKPANKEKAPPVKKSEVKPREEAKANAKVVSDLADDFRNAVSVTVDLQGPPLPAPAAVVTPVEVEKPVIPAPAAAPAAPAVFNYAAAARANLPPKQPTATPAVVQTPTPAAAKQQEPPVVTSNNSSVSRETTPTAKNVANAKPNAGNQQRGGSKESNSSVSSNSKGAPSSFAKMTAGGNRKAKK